MVKLSFDALIQKILQYKKETKQNRLYASLPKSFQFPSEQTKICFVVVLFEKCGYKSSIENIIELKKKKQPRKKKKTIMTRKQTRDISWIFSLVLNAMHTCNLMAYLLEIEQGKSQLTSSVPLVKRPQFPHNNSRSIIQSQTLFCQLHS